MLRRLHLLFFSLLVFAPFGIGQMVPLSGSHIQDLSGAPLKAGQICFSPVNNSGTPISFLAGGGGQVLPVTKCTPVTSGAFSVSVADTAASNPANVCYSTQVVIPGNPQRRYTLNSCLQPSRTITSANSAWCTTSACNLDNYIPTGVPGAVVTAGPAGQAPTITTGTMTVGVNAADYSSTLVQTYADQFTRNYQWNVKFPLAPSATDTTKLPLAGGTLSGLLASPTDLFSGYSIGQTTTPTNTRSSSSRTFTSPEIYYGLLDTSPATSNSGAQADGRLTPSFHMEINDQSPNDSAFFYGNHTCNYPTGTPSVNGACVGMVPIAIQAAGDEHYGLEAINGICSEQATNPNVQMQCEELNVFNLTGMNSDILPSGSYSSGPHFGYSATAGGPNSMVAGFNCQDQASMTTGAGWNHCFWAERWIEDAILVGVPGGATNGAVGLHQVAQSAATSSSNFNSIQIELDDSYFASGSAHPFATYLGTLVGTGSSPLHCFAIGFTGISNAWYTCSDGSTSVGGQLNVTGPVVISGTGGNNIQVQSPSATIKLGSATSTGTPSVKLNSSGTGSDFDVQLLASGGTSTAGNGTLNIKAAALQINGNAGFSGVKTAGACVLTISNGLIINVTGC